MTTKKTRGYKAFNPDWTCRGFQYEVGKSYTANDPVIMCQSGFHFCENILDCFNYYPFSEHTKIAEVEGTGVKKDSSDSKCVAEKITILKEIEWGDVLKLANAGKFNVGFANTGNWNAGDRNTGSNNTGSLNTGCRNGGCQNTGDRNTGDYNTGDHNTGDYNTGNCNTGDYNTGNCNTGDCNTGDYNTGDRNTGNWNAGNWNAGDYNVGWNNAGDWNTGDWNTGCFCEDTPKLNFFDKETIWTLSDWWKSQSCAIMKTAPGRTKWIVLDEMNDEEKLEYPESITINGYLRIRSNEELRKERQDWWDHLSYTDKQTIRNLPNFDEEKFERIMGGISI